MYKIRKLFPVLMIIIGVLAISFTTSAAVPNIDWEAQDAEWYQVILAEGDHKVIDEWMKDENGLCNQGTCTFDPDTLLALGLDTGEYAVTVNYWDATNGIITELKTDTLTISNAETSITTPNARVRLQVPDDPRLEWLQVWMGNADTLATVTQSNRPGDAAGWYSRTDDMNCNNGTCTIWLAAYPINGDYIAYMRWYNVDDGLSDWSGSFAFTMNAPQTSAVGNMQADLNGQLQPTLTWNGQAGATWYRTWLGGNGNTVIDQWQSALDLGCVGGGTCTFNPNVMLGTGSTYAWYVHTWGPAGYATGGLDGTGWAKGPVIDTPSNDAPTFTSSPPPNGLLDVAYNHTLNADGDTPITYEVTSGSLPTGLNLNGNTISGTPTQQGTFNGVITATNNVGTAMQAFAITIGTTSGDAFVMQNDLIVIEVESVAPVGDWSLRTGTDGYTGNGYYVWRFGNTDAKTQPSGIDIISYPIIIPEAGQYRFLMRGTSPAPGSEYNDIFLRIQGEGSTATAIKSDGSSTVQLGNSWFKSYNNSVDSWRWQSSHVDNNGHQIFFSFDGPGEYVVQISGRSHQFQMDRFVIFDQNNVTVGQATNLENPESPRQ